MKPGPGDIKLTILINGDELHELKRFTIDMAEAYGLDRRIKAYTGKRAIGFYRWDLDCLSAVIDNALKDERAYPDNTSLAYVALRRLHDRLETEYRNAWAWTAVCGILRAPLLSGANTVNPCEPHRDVARQSRSECADGKTPVFRVSGVSA